MTVLTFRFHVVNKYYPQIAAQFPLPQLQIPTAEELKSFTDGLEQIFTASERFDLTSMMPIKSYLMSMGQVYKDHIKFNIRDIHEKYQNHFTLLSSKILESKTLPRLVQPPYFAAKDVMSGLPVSTSLLLEWIGGSENTKDLNYWWISTWHKNSFRLSIIRIFEMMRNLDGKVLYGLSTEEFKAVKSALGQLKDSLEVTTFNSRSPKLTAHLAKGLLTEQGFTYMAFDNGKIAKFELQTESTAEAPLYRVTLYGACNKSIPSHRRQLADGTIQYCTHIKLINMTMADLEQQAFFSDFRQEKNGVPIFLKPYDMVPVDVNVDHHWFTKARSSHLLPIRFLIQDILGSFAKERLIRYEISREMIKDFKANRGTSLRYSHALDHLMMLKRDHSARTPAKLLRQFAQTKSEDEFKCMQRVLQIHRDDIATFLEDIRRDSIGPVPESKKEEERANVEEEKVIAEWKRLEQLPKSPVAPLIPSELYADNAKMLPPSNAVLEIIAFWKGFTSQLPPSFLAIQAVLPFLLRHTDLTNAITANRVLSYIILIDVSNSLPLVGLESLRELLWNPQVDFPYHEMAYSLPGPWLELLLTAGADAEQKIFSPTTIKILEAYAKGSQTLVEGPLLQGVALFEVCEFLTGLMQKNPLMNACLSALPAQLKTNLWLDLQQQ